MSCDYQGYEFGAGRYPDSVCVDGQLFDADACDAPGGPLYEPPDYFPCPQCRQLEAMNLRADDWVEDLDCRWPRYSAWHLVKDIRRNRGLRALPLVAWIAYRLWTELTTFDRDWWFRARRFVW